MRQEDLRESRVGGPGGVGVFTTRRRYRAGLGLWASGWLESWWERDSSGNSLRKKTRQKG